ncbi:MAG: FKBP-type peptidyl-prolyl cis-trans isomerase [Salinivirgaceae bacterium]|jgi:FKBP-type peptidyl-prolyl cis-trans isomerase
MTKFFHSFLFVIFLGVLLLASCKQNSSNAPVADRKTQKENLLKANKGLVSLDQQRIKNYAKRRNWEMQVSETGLWYQLMDTNTNEKAMAGKIAHLKYQVSLLDGTICYTSDSLGVMQFKIGQGGVESGLEEAILLMRVGEKGRFILPPHLAHGLLGDDNKIPPRSVIVYSAELLKLTDY